MYLYIKSIHIIFVVTWFAGLFYMPRLFIYNREAQDKPEAERKILQQQFSVMSTRLWYGITWPSCIITTVLGTWIAILLGEISGWLQLKLVFVFGLLLYHLSLHVIYKQQQKNIFKYTSQQLRIWNEVATVFLFAIVFLVEIKTELSVVWGLLALLLFIALLMVGIRVYKLVRKN